MISLPLPAAVSDWLAGSGLQPLILAGRTLLPVVQGGMGVGVSASGLAGSVAALGAVGTLSSVDLRRHHPDLMEQTEHLDVKDPKSRALIDSANLEALRREIRQARARAQGPVSYTHLTLPTKRIV